MAQTGYQNDQGTTINNSDRDWFSESRSRDDRQRISSITNHVTSASTPTLQYFASTGLLQSITDGANHETLYGYNNDPFGRVQTVQRDASGLNATTTFGYTGPGTTPTSLTLS